MPDRHDAAADAAATSPSLLDGEAHVAAESTSNGRRALVVGGVAALGASAVAFGGALLGWFGAGGDPVGLGPNGAPHGGGANGGGAPGTGTPLGGGTPPAPGQTGPAVTPGPGGTLIGPNGQIGGGAPMRPLELIEVADRDDSFSAPFVEQHPIVSGTDPQLPAGRTAGPITMPIADSPAARRHLVHRAAYGVGAGAEADIERAGGLEAWLGQQLDPSATDDAESTIRGWFPLAFADIPTTRGSVERYSWDGMIQVPQATLARQLFGSRQVYEQVVDVLSNYVHVTVPFDGGWDNAADYQNTVIRANAFGSFRDLLLAAGRHPAMLQYLNNVDSVDGEINENYGRELLELHTVGVGGGYTEDDVKASAVIMSGRRIDWETGAFVYEARHHVTRPVRVLDCADDNASAAAGLELGDRYLSYLATHPSTARMLARKLAVRFISDTPSEATVEHLAEVYLANDTQVLPVVTELFRTTEFWTTAGAKIRRPLEDAVATVRSVGATHATSNAPAVTDLYWLLRRVGHAPLAWAPPNGYPDVASAWMSASQLIQRWNLHRGIVHGWRDGLEPSAAFNTAIMPVHGESVDEWVTRLCALTIGAEPTEQLRSGAAALLGRAGFESTDTSVDKMAGHLAALLYNSPSFAIR